MERSRSLGGDHPPDSFNCLSSKQSYPKSFNVPLKRGILQRATELLETRQRKGRPFCHYEKRPLCHCKERETRRSNLHRRSKVLTLKYVALRLHVALQGRPDLHRVRD